MTVQAFSKGRKGSITVFLTLIITTLISFVTAMLDCAVIKTYGSVKSVDANMAVHSLFGEYQDELFNEYSILAVDSRYGKDAAKEKYIEDRLRYYGTEDIEHKIEGIQMLTDKDCASFRLQAVKYIEGPLNNDRISSFDEKKGLWEEIILKGREASKKDKEYGDLLGSLKEEFVSSESDDENVFEVLENVRRSETIDKLVQNGMEISNRKINTNDMSSKRKLRSGKGLKYDTLKLYSTTAKLSFNEYVLEKFKNMTDVRENCKGLMYETEYIIGGRDSDKENLEEVAKKLIYIRMVSNYKYLKTSTSKNSEVTALSAAIAVIMQNLELEKIIKELLIWLWSYTESKCDVSALLSGLKVPEVKTDATWQSGLYDCFSDNVTYFLSDREDGLSYKDYLRMVLYVTDAKEVTKRALDMIEVNIRAKRSGFKIDNCFVKIKLQNEASLIKGVRYCFPMEFGYE